MLFPPDSLREQVGAIARKHAGLSDTAAFAREVLALDPENPMATMALATTAKDEGNLEEAERLFWKALQLQPFGVRQYACLMAFYQGRPETQTAAHAFYILAVWASAFSDEVDP